MGKLLPGQLSSAESTAAFAQHGTGTDKCCLMLAMPTQSHSWWLCIASPKQREQWRDALGVHLDVNPAGHMGSMLMPPGALSAYPSMQHFHSTCSPCCHAQPGRAPCICIVPNQIRDPPRSWGLLQTHPRGSVGASPGLSWPQPRTWTQHVWLHPPCLFTETLKCPYTKSPMKPSGTNMINASLLPGNLRSPLPQQTESLLSSVDMHVATSH